jgi:hypothetical protein
MKPGFHCVSLVAPGGVVASAGKSGGAAS